MLGLCYWPSLFLRERFVVVIKSLKNNNFDKEFMKNIYPVSCTFAVMKFVLDGLAGCFIEPCDVVIYNVLLFGHL